jgi:hypothetical protein
MIKNQYGNSMAWVFAFVFVLFGVAGSAVRVTVLNKEKDKKAAEAQTAIVASETEKPASTEQPTDSSDKYAGWKTYANDTYGITFRYPVEWKYDEGSKQDYGGDMLKTEGFVNLRHDIQEKYSETIAVEVHDMPIADAVKVYDSMHGQSTTLKVTKNEAKMKGKPAIAYTFSKTGRAGSERELYLFDVREKTYSFESINEENNVGRSKLYWDNFEKVFDSLEIE